MTKLLYIIVAHEKKNQSLKNQLNYFLDFN